MKRINLSTTIDINGRTVFIQRYIRPQEPPKSLNSVEQLVRYVSLIPFIPNRTAFAAECDIWCTSDQVLDIGAADAVEHAIILCNFLLYKGCEAFIIFGRGIPDGNVCYVLLRDDKASSSTSLTNLPVETEDEKKKDRKLPQKYTIFNPVTGEKYQVQDTHIPLKEIGMVFNADNVSPFYILNFIKQTDVCGMTHRFGLTFRNSRI
jgi:coiled-coil and C2 domain-containing protein 2A